MTGHQQAEESRSQGPARAGKHIQKDGTALGGSGGTVIIRLYRSLADLRLGQQVE